MKASVDVRERSKRLIMDIITELLLKSSTGTSVRKDCDDLNAFSSACGYSQKVVWRKIAIAPKAMLASHGNFFTAQLINMRSNSSGKSKREERREKRKKAGNE